MRLVQAYHVRLRFNTFMFRQKVPWTFIYTCTRVHMHTKKERMLVNNIARNLIFYYEITQSVIAINEKNISLELHYIRVT